MHILLDTKPSTRLNRLRRQQQRWRWRRQRRPTKRNTVPCLHFKTATSQPSNTQWVCIHSVFLFRSPWIFFVIKFLKVYFEVPTLYIYLHSIDSVPASSAHMNWPAIQIRHVLADAKIAHLFAEYSIVVVAREGILAHTFSASNNSTLLALTSERKKEKGIEQAIHMRLFANAICAQFRWFEIFSIQYKTQTSNWIPLGILLSEKAANNLIRKLDLQSQMIRWWVPGFSSEKFVQITFYQFTYFMPNLLV